MGKSIAELVGSAYENWYGEKVFLDCGSEGEVESFVLEQVCPMAAATGKEILYLTNTTRMQEEKQRRERADAEKVLRVMDYAEFEQMVQYHVAYDGQYDYIFAEDCRVLLESEREPAYSAVIYDFLMQAEHSAVIFVGADAKGLREYLISSGKLMPENLFVLPRIKRTPEQVVFVQKERGKSTGVRLAQELVARYPEERIVYFCSSKEKMRLAGKIFKTKASYFYGVDALENTCMMRENKISFRKDILVADGRSVRKGLSIQGAQRIIIDLFDIDQLLSCLEALRSEEPFRLYVVEYNKTQLRYLRGIFETQIENLYWFEQLERGEGAEFMKRSQSPRFLAENPVFFIGQADEYGNCRFQVNSKQRALCEIGIAVLDAIQKMGYQEWVMQALGGGSQAQQQMQLPRFTLDEKNKAELLEKIDAQKGKKLAGEELVFFRRYLCEKLGRKSISVSMANTLFEKLGIPYQVSSKKERARTSPYYNQHYWFLEQAREK